MRRLIALALLASFALSAPIHLIGNSHYVGEVKGTAYLPYGGENILAVITERSATQAHLRVHRTSLEMFYHTGLRGRPVGIVTHGSSVLTSTYLSGKIKTIAFTARGDRVVHQEWADVDVGALRNVRGLACVSTTAGPLLVMAYRGGIVMVTLSPRGRPRLSQIARPGRHFVAITPPFRLNRDGNADMIAVDQSGIILQLQENGNTWSVVREGSCNIAGFAPHAVVGRTGEFWIGGHTGNTGQVHRFTGRTRRPRRIGPIVVEEKWRGFRAASSYNMGTGVVNCLAWCDKNLLAAAGSKSGRAWAGVIDCSTAQARVSGEAYYKGAECTQLGVNTKRRGWSLYTFTKEKYAYMSRLHSDPALPRDWNPFRQKDPDPVPHPAPGSGGTGGTGPGAGGTNPGTGADPHDHDHDHGSGSNGARTKGNTAILPTVSADVRRGEDTEIVLVQINSNDRVVVRLISDRGRVLHSRTISMRRDRRVKVSLIAELRGLGIPSFEGYIRIDGGKRNDLIVDAVRREPNRSENLRVHWR